AGLAKLDRTGRASPAAIPGGSHWPDVEAKLAVGETLSARLPLFSHYLCRVAALSGRVASLEVRSSAGDTQLLAGHVSLAACRGSESAGPAHHRARRAGAVLPMAV